MLIGVEANSVGMPSVAVVAASTTEGSVEAYRVCCDQRKSWWEGSAPAAVIDLPIRAPLKEPFNPALLDAFPILCRFVPNCLALLTRPAWRVVKPVLVLGNACSSG